MISVNADSIKEYIMSELLKILELPEGSLSMDDNIINLGISSMEIVELYLNIGERFNVDLSDKLDLHMNHISINIISEFVSEKISSE